MQPNFIIRTNYFKVSRTVRHNVMAKETVLVARGLEIERREEDSVREGGGGGGEIRGSESREGEHRAENIISLGTRLPCLCCHSLR